jgi:hypothetical protein
LGQQNETIPDEFPRLAVFSSSQVLVRGRCSGNLIRQTKCCGKLTVKPKTYQLGHNPEKALNASRPTQLPFFNPEP